MCFKDGANNIRCDAWVSLYPNGVLAEGCLRDPSWIHSLVVSSNQSIFNQHIYIDLPTLKLKFIRNITHGSFGFIDLASLETEYGAKEVYVKRPIHPGKSLFYEACIQKAVGKSLEKIGFPTGAPKVVRLFSLRDKSVCFAMDVVEGSCTLDKYLESVPPAMLSRVIIDCLLQLCAMIYHLHSVLGMNHRDLKPSNFLIVVHETPVRKVLRIEREIIEIMSSYSLTLIDFGFSCIGSVTTQKADVSFSTVHEKDDPCPKEGRDLFLFAGFLYASYYDKLPTTLRCLLESWIDQPGANLCKYIRKDAETSKKWLYFMAANTNIKKFHSSPIRIVTDLNTFLEKSAQQS